VVSKEIYDITIIGGGPTGMFAAFYAGMRNAKVKVIDALPILGGQVSLLYPDKTIYDIGGFPAVTGAAFIEGLRQQMAHFDHTVCLDEKVELVEKKQDGTFLLTTGKGVHRSKSIIIAAGNGAFDPRKLPIENAEQFEHQNLHYMAVEKEQYKDATVVICGGGDSAVDWALELEKTAKKVYLVHRREAFRAHEYAVSLLKKSTIEVLTPFVPDALYGSNGKLEAVRFKKTRSNEMVTLPLDYFIVNFGFTSSIGPFKNWGLETTKSEVMVNAKMETNIPGIYAAGDIAWYKGKIKLIATAFGDAPTAVNHAIHYIDPEKRTQPIQSTQLHLE